jgi:WD40 repeat protein
LQELCSYPNQIRDSIIGERLKTDLTEEQQQLFSQRFSSAVLSPDGRWVAALRQGPGAPALVLYDAATLHEVRSLSGYSREDDRVLSFSPDSRELAAIGHQPGADPKWPMETTLKVWDTSTGQLLRTLRLNYEGGVGVGAMALSSDWQWLATVAGRTMREATSIDVWEVSTGRHVRTLAGLPVRWLEGGLPPLKAQGAAPDYPPDEADIFSSALSAKMADGAAAQKGSNPGLGDFAILQYQHPVELAPNDPELHFKLGAQFEARGAAVKSQIICEWTHAIREWNRREVVETQ